MDNKKNHNAHNSANVRQYLPILSIVIIFSCCSQVSQKTFSRCCLERSAL